MAEEEFAVDVVFQDIAGGACFVWLAEACCCEAAGFGVGREDLVGGWDAGSAFFDGSDVELDAVDGFEEGLGDSLRY